MTISYVAAGAAAALTTTGAPGYPAGMSANDMMLLFIKSDSTATPGTPSGWTARGTTVNAAGIYSTMFSKSATGSESGTLTVSGLTSGTKGVAQILAYHATVAGPYVKNTQQATDTDTSSTAYSASGSSWSVASGDWIVSYTASAAPSGSYSASGTGPAVANAGVTVTSTSRLGARTGTNTIYYNATDASASTTASGAPLFTATTVGANGAGVTSFILLSETNPNVPPTANAGTDQTGIAPGATVTLNGTGSSDSDGTIASYAWTQTAGTTVTLSSSSVASPTFTAPSVYGGTTLTFSLVVTDNGGATSSADTVDISVTTGSDTISYVGNGAASGNTTATTPGYPTVAANDRLIMVAFSDVNVQPTDPAGWGTGTTVAGGGGLYVTMWAKTATGSETGTVTVSGFTGGTKGLAWITGYRRASGTAISSVNFTTGADTDSSSTTFSATGSSWSPIAGDYLLGMAALLAPSGTYSGNPTTPVLDNASVTETSSVRFAGRASSNTIGYAHTDAVVTSGGTGTPTLTATGTGANASGMVGFVRLSVTANVAPTANAGADQTGIAPGATVTLNGTGSTDSDGTVTGYAWTQTSGPTVTLSSATAASPTFTAPSVFGGTTLVFSLTVTDNAGATSSADTVSISVTTGSDSIARVGDGSASAITTATTPGYPTGLAANDKLVMWAFSDAATQPSNPSGWGTGTTVASGGGLYLTMWSKNATGSETGSQTVSGFTGTKGVAWMSAYRRSSGSALYVDLASGADTDTSSTTFSATGPSWTVATGDYLAGALVILAPSGSYTGIPGTPLINNASVTETSTVRFAGRSATNTLGYAYVDATVSSGGTGAPTLTATGTGANAAGMAGFARLTMTAPNTAPVANAGADQAKLPGDTVTLDGSGSTDSDGTIVTYTWTQTAGPTVTLSGTGASRTFTAPHNLGGTTITFSLTVTDNGGLTSPADTVDIVVASSMFFVLVGGVWTGTTISTF